VLRLVQALDGELSREALQEALGLAHRDHFMTAYLQPTLDQGLVELTIPDKPRSSKQCYRLTAAGLRLKQASSGDSTA
jgi:ATP-dependent DNA helicase RecG